MALGGRGQLRDWEIFNRPDKGKSVSYTFPSIWSQVGNGKPVARVLESRLMPPYEAGSGLSPNQVSGLTRMEGRSNQNGRTRFSLSVLAGNLPCRSVEVVGEAAGNAQSSASLEKNHCPTWASL